ncbi:hypothetical protein MBLNU457_6208t1 [Dothideomycetes sp. NU457]
MGHMNTMISTPTSPQQSPPDPQADSLSSSLSSGLFIPSRRPIPGSLRSKGTAVSFVTPLNAFAEPSWIADTGMSDTTTGSDRQVQTVENAIDDASTDSDISSFTASQLRLTASHRYRHHNAPDVPAERPEDKLAAWSRENQDLVPHMTGPLTPASHSTHSGRQSGDEGVPTPPNTEDLSPAPSRRQSTPHSTSTPWSRWNLNADKAPTSLSTPPTPVGFPRCEDASISNISKQLSTSALQDQWLRTHRDSVTLAHQRLVDHKTDKENPQLQSIRDSIILTKSRFDKYPKSHLKTDPLTGKVTFGGLSPIQDASPPDNRAYHRSRPTRQDARDTFSSGSLKTVIDTRESHRNKESSRTVDHPKQVVEIGGHPDDDDGCAICAIERPRSKQ